MTATNDTQNREAKAETGRAETKEQRARDAAQAMQDYQAERLAVLAKTARLRAERLAREAAGTVQATAPKAATLKATTPKATVLKAKTPRAKTLKAKTLKAKTPTAKTKSKEKT